MASLSENKSDGTRRILVVIGRRLRTIHLGTMPEKKAAAVLEHVESLVATKATGSPREPQMTLWLASIDDTLHAKLAKLDFVTARVRPEDRDDKRLGEFLSEYIAGRSDVKPRTILVMKHARDNLVEYFKADKLLGDITEGDGDEWRLWLMGKKHLSQNTAGRRCRCAKQFFRRAVKKKSIPVNPFAER
jgi:hypothetical protein